MDVVIPLKNCRNNEELRYALRSFQLHFKPERAILVGGKPDWFTGDNIPHEDYHPLFKEKNIFDKTNIGAAQTDGDFYFCNDDHFVLSPYWGLHHKGSMLTTYKQRNPNGTYGRMLLNTLETFGEHIDNYDTHCPMIMNKQGIDNIKLDWAIHNGYGFKTSYVYSNGLTGTFYHDAKYHSIPVNINRPYFSISESCSNLNRLKSLYPNKSKWEK